MNALALHFGGNLGNIAGPNSDGVLFGAMTATNPTKVLLKSTSAPILCFTDDGGAYVDETTDINSATSNDVFATPATPAVDDAIYFGHASIQFDSVSLNISTQGAGTWTIVWEYWDGTTWTEVADIDDLTVGFTGTTGAKVVSYTLPEDWEQCTVDSVNGYWVRARVSAYTSITTRPQLAQGWVISTAGAWTDDLTDFTDAGAGDCKALPDTPAVGDGLYIGYTAKFCKIKVTVGTARTGTATLAMKYWNGSAWTAFSAADIDDDSAGWSTGTSTYYIHFVPPTDWVANTVVNGPNGQTGFFVVMELTALTTVTAQPLITQGWIYPLVTGASGVPIYGRAQRLRRIGVTAGTKSGSTADSKFLAVNVDTGEYGTFTWTKTLASLAISNSMLLAFTSDVQELAIVQITEDGTTEFADANFVAEFS